MVKLAPICLFTYNRLNETKQTIKALQRNHLASESELFIFSDGGKNNTTKFKVNEVREFIKTVKGFKSVKIFESKENKGLANSIIHGVSKIIQKFGQVIVLEDDLITSPNFLNFMNQGLNYYQKDEKIFSISGYTMELPSLNNYKKDFYTGYRASSWGWATWLNKWDNVDWEVQSYSKFRWSFLGKLNFMRGGVDMPGMLKKQMKGKIDSWAIRWCYHQFRVDGLTIYPSKSKVFSVGFGSSATHTKKTKRFDTTLDPSDKLLFEFDENVSVNKVLAREFKNKFSILNRIKDKL